MSPQFVVDVGVGKAVEKFLSQKGYDIVCIRDIDPRMPDEKILEIAVQQKRVVLTMDKDFGELVYNSGLPHKGVLLLRLEQENASAKVRVLSQILVDYIQDLEDHFCVYQKGNLRIKK